MKYFSAGPIDLALEQTINADAASQRTGISSITNSISARHRWAESHSLETKIISMLFEQLAITKKDDISRDLKANQMKKNSQDMAKKISLIGATMNAFSGKISAAMPETTEFLLNCKKIG